MALSMSITNSTLDKAHPNTWVAARSLIDTKRVTSKLDFAHFGEALSLSQARVQKIRSCSMTRRASSSGRTVRPKGPVDAHFSFHEDQ